MGQHSQQEISVRGGQFADVPALARVHVDTWRETYRGLMRDDVLDDSELLERRRRFWTAALSDPRYERNRTAVAEHDDRVIGIAMSGPPTDAAAGLQQLCVLYAYALSTERASALLSFQP